MISKKLLEELKEIVKTDYQKTLSDKEAFALGSFLLSLGEIIVNTNKKPGSNQEETLKNENDQDFSGK